MTDKTSKSEEQRKSNMDDMKEAMNDYLSKSADYIGQMVQETNSKQPSLTVSELQIHSSISNLTNTGLDKKSKRFYQFLFIAIMIASLSILISLIFHFFELKRHKAYHEAYYKYLHKAIEIKQNNSDQTIISLCTIAIHHFDIVSLYKSANINVAILKVDIEKLQKYEKNTKYKKKLNKKEELIIMCDIDIRLMMNITTEEHLESERILSLKESNKKHHDAFYKYLHKAIKIKQESPNKDILSCCYSAIHNVDIISLYKAANIDFSNLIADIKQLKNIIDTNTGNTHKPLNQKEELIKLCQVELTLMTNAVENEIQQTQKNNHKYF